MYAAATNSFSDAPPDCQAPKIQRKTRYPKRPALVVSFGDVFLLDEFLKKSGLMAAVDATGYRNSDTLHALLDAGVSFMARMKSNFNVYKSTMKNHLNHLECRQNAVLFNRRLVYIKCIPCRIGEKQNRPAFAYLCKDMTMSHEEQKRAIERADDENLTGSDTPCNNPLYGHFACPGIQILSHSG